MTTTTTGGIHLAIDDRGVGWITLDNPAKANAISPSMWESLASALAAFETDNAVHSIVLGGQGSEAFCAGVDISHLEQARSGAEASAEYDRISKGTIVRLQALPKPTIAMIAGYCIGAGVALAAACDLRVAATGARFGIPAARLGIGYFYAGVKQLVDLVGPAQAKRLLFTGDKFGAEEMLRIGLVDEVVAAQHLSERVSALAAAIAANAPLSVAAAKFAVATARSDGAPDVAACSAQEAACNNSEDHAEGRRAFLEKRVPKFQGH